MENNRTRTISEIATQGKLIVLHCDDAVDGIALGAAVAAAVTGGPAIAGLQVEQKDVIFLSASVMPAEIAAKLACAGAGADYCQILRRPCEIDMEILECQVIDDGCLVIVDRAEAMLTGEADAISQMNSLAKTCADLGGSCLFVTFGDEIYDVLHSADYAVNDYITLDAATHESEIVITVCGNPKGGAIVGKSNDEGIYELRVRR